MKHLILLFVFAFSVKYSISQTNYVGVIDKSITSTEFKTLTVSMGESPTITDHLHNGWKYYSYYKSGLEILVINGKVHTIFFHNKKNPKFSTFSGQLPKNITWGLEKSEVRSKVGTPTQSGGGGEFLGEPVLYWDKYAYSAYALHITYKSGAVYEVSIMSLIKP
jgi:hypothetical protein